MRHRKITPFLSDSWVHKYSGERGLVVPNSLPLLPQPSSLRSRSHGRKSFFFFFLITTSLTYIKNTWLKKKNTFIYLFNCACVACRIFVPWPGIKPRPPALGGWNLNHWATSEVPVQEAWILSKPGVQSCCFNFHGGLSKFPPRLFPLELGVEFDAIFPQSLEALGIETELYFVAS